MIRTFSLVVVALSGLLMVSGSHADVLMLHDGSQLVGRVVRVENGQVRFETGFAGEMTVDLALVKGIISDEPVNVELETGERAVGELQFKPKAGQSVASQKLGQTGFELGGVAAIWAQDEPSPEAVVMQAKLDKAASKWSVTLEGGLDGQTGNTEKLAMNGRLQLNRDTDSERLKIYGQGRFAEENQERSVNEIMGGASLEVDVDEKNFLFGRADLEFDEFENLDLRSTLAVGAGRFLVREDDHEMKVRGGVGFMHESFDDGTTDDQAVLELGFDFMKQLNEWLRFTHSTTYYPTLERLDDFRLVAETAGEVPLGDGRAWTFRVGMRNNYDAMPTGDVDRLDTYYFFNIVWKMK